LEVCAIGSSYLRISVGVVGAKGFDHGSSDERTNGIDGINLIHGESWDEAGWYRIVRPRYTAS
jgi:hypothetical protein